MGHDNETTTSALAEWGLRPLLVHRQHGQVQNVRLETNTDLRELGFLQTQDGQGSLVRLETT